MKTLSIAMVFCLSVLASSNKDKIVNAWKLAQIEEFGSKFDVGKDNEKDELTIKADGSFSMIVNQEAKSGTYTFANNRITFKSGKESFFFNVLSVDASNLKIKWQQPSLITSIYHYVKK